MWRFKIYKLQALITSIFVEYLQDGLVQHSKSQSNTRQLSCRTISVNAWALDCITQGTFLDDYGNHLMIFT